MKRIAYIELDTHAEIAANFMELMDDSEEFVVDYYFSETYLKKQNIFNIDATRKLISDFRNNKNVLPGKIWYFLMFFTLNV